MIKEIKYNGFSAARSDYESPDGELSGLIGLVPEDGTLKPIQPPKVLFKLPEGKKVLHIHTVSTFKNYIIYDAPSDTLQWLASEETDKQPTDIVPLDGREIYQVTSIGNTIVILSSEGLIYALYKSGEYVLMGSQPAFPAISFRLKSNTESSEWFKPDFSSFKILVNHPGILAFIPPDIQKQFTDIIMGYLNPYMADCKKGGYFQFPFMIRYAYRMYDDTINYISPPAKIYPSFGMPFTAETNPKLGPENNVVLELPFFISSHVSKLLYQITNIEEVKASLSQWGELVKSIDIFVTPPLYMVDENTICDKVVTTSSLNDGYQINRIAYDEDKIQRIINPFEDSRGIQFLFSMSSKRLVEDDSSYPFHLVASIEVKDLLAGEHEVPLKPGVLETINADGEGDMDGANNINGTMVAKYAFPYNSRLNLTGVTTMPPTFPLESHFQYADGLYEGHGKGIKKTYAYTAYIFIEAEKRNVMVTARSGIPMNIINSYFFYPNINAKRLILERIDDKGIMTYSDTEFKKHKMLNGVYTSINTSFTDTPDMSIVNNTDRGIPYPNKIYTSNSNDPFSFPASGVNAVGSAEIIGLSAAAKALSQGQFGQFPLYCFSTDGVWALEVSPTGSYSARQPITRDVCVSSESITQIDTAVLFSTDRGIMLISGSESLCISDILNSDRAHPGVSNAELPHFEQIVGLSNFDLKDFEYLNFRQFMKGCSMIYDYAHQRIIVHNPTCSYAYVYSLESKRWGMMHSDIDYGINSYPEAIAMNARNELINLSQPDEANAAQTIQGMLITRAVKLDDPDLFKTIDTVIQRGHFPKRKVASVLYGSRDLYTWHPVWSSKDHYLRGFRGTPYKYFRIVLIADLLKDESIDGCSIQYTPRLTNKLR